ncbi:TAXI family TRAP transporter solute-binding subunit [Geothermobacter hydrogeniphilus]|uniref:C4-dicarboxylate ABC transporter substrate-binding protein n=1 Tax=Geothermobacter hydrogeniphilus TaxID=1969733 RepID=A0A1X0XQ46_9BACT|nr:TAXI family TRAP transporter solute-binding subunit [Geothermobacter hydrogeniphilus]ORJ55029.1 C4-dicarboxylate ABC transporter substrate-binding protein [Geothermobacter hydrogeniphilus]
MKRFWIACLSLLVTLSFIPLTSSAARVRYVTIGTGGVTGVYYPTGGAIAKMVNKKRKLYNLRATVESTGGSVFNINAIKSGDLEFGIVQSDRQYQAYNGTADWEGKPFKKLRAVFSIHPESVTIVAAADKHIRTINDLRGKVVNIGNPGSGQRGNAIDALTAAGIDYKKDLKAEGLKAAESAGMLQDGRIDAFFYTVGHPNGSVKEAVAGARKVNFVEVPKPIVDKLVAQFPYYASSFIPVDQYPGVTNKENVPTFGVKATLCTSADVPDDVVYAITKEVFENFEEFKKLHPAYAVLTKESMLQGLSAPIHPGALRYYKEAGLLK